MVKPDHKDTSRAHQEAAKRLRHKFHAEYRALLHEVYAEWGLEVRKRRSRQELLEDRLAEARRLLEENS